jgi:adenosine deaminase
MNSLAQFIREMPKAEIHVHLEGAIQPETVLKLARHNKLTHLLPTTDLNALQKWFIFTDFPHFVKIYVTIQNLLRTPDDFALIAYECGADMAAQNIRYRECTITPYTHTDFLDKGLTIHDILAGLNTGQERAKQELGVEMRWVFDVPRNLSFKGEDGRYSSIPADRTLEFALHGRAQGVVGFGLGGYEVGAPPEPFAHAFHEAKKAGLLSLPHAGETEGAASVWGAVRELQADRIGHGVRAIEDPTLLTLLKEQQIPLEINPTSNQCLHVYPLAAHPFRQLDEMGLLVTLNSDDPPLFNTSLCQEYEIAVREFGYKKADLLRIARNAFVVAGLETEVKTDLLVDFDQWFDITSYHSEQSEES